MISTLLADPRAERAACGTGFVAHLSARPSHAILRDALNALANLAHRGAHAADGKSGDGAGVLTQIPYRLFAREIERQGHTPPARGDLAVGMCFLPCDDLRAREHARQIVSAAIHARGLQLLGWRAVPIQLDALGEHARHTRPHVEQVLIARPAPIAAGDAFERALYLVRKDVERRARVESIQPLYLPSLSARTVVYKGLFVSPQLAPFYADLRDPLYETALALFHQRYSTNTFPTWERAQPFRFLCHNGEINTLQGNITWMRAREGTLASPLWGDQIKALLPVIDSNGSDSAMLDNVLELLAQSGRDLPHALMLLVPEAWEKVPDLAEARRAFYRYHASMMEPWDGPAALAFSDGRVAGMALDRNGLRPARYLVTDDGFVLAASESGVLDIDPARVLEKGKLGPGQMLLADLAQGRLWHDGDLKEHYAAQQPYQQWVDQNIRTLENAPSPPSSNVQLPISTLQSAFGYTDEELVVVLRPMAEDAVEPVGSMGDDTPHAVLSAFERPLYHYFKQRFAEVTNPPIDPLREQLVMSTRTLLGPRGNLLAVDPLPHAAACSASASFGASPMPCRAEVEGRVGAEQGAYLLELPSPLLTQAQLDALRSMCGDFPHAVLDATFPAHSTAVLAAAVADLCTAAERALDAGAVLLILSDRALDAQRAPIPMLLAVSAVHQHLLNAGKRWQASLVAEAGDARDVHHFACLIGYGASAIHPWLALASVRALVESGSLRGLDLTKAEAQFVHAAEKGLLKVMSKMGIATLDAYHGAQVFECIGLADDVVDPYFAGTPSPIGGAGLADLARGVLAHHTRAFKPDGATAGLKHYGFFKFKKHGEYHAMNPELVGLLHEAVRTPGAVNGHFQVAFEKYRHFSARVHARPSTDLSDHLQFAEGSAIPLDDVEPVSNIVKRFSTAAMSHGALSLEAHKAIAVATNRLGALSNSGEGGEHPSRYGGESNSPIKQVASARFGVTPAYLMSADELQIKMAQGSKPGEGGQLPAHKVSAEIAAIRYAQPGIALISPPPHHDIYSIEDLAQLIYDLKRVNPRAKVSVKLVAQAGIGTIAAGVVKAHADIVQVSGHSGGTGASPLSSIKHAGVAWELGLAETQQILVANDLRARVRLRVDGGLKTGRHVVVASLLGADEFSFGTAAVVAGGCIMARVCHLNTCPTGIATQREDLRRKFPDVPEWIMAYLLFVAEETREYLAALGYRSLDEAIGRVERLVADTRPRARPARAARAVPTSIPSPPRVTITG